MCVCLCRLFSLYFYPLRKWAFSKSVARAFFASASSFVIVNWYEIASMQKKEVDFNFGLKINSKTIYKVGFAHEIWCLVSAYFWIIGPDHAAAAAVCIWLYLREFMCYIYFLLSERLYNKLALNK